MLVNRMGSFEHFESSLAEPLHDLWDFASDHPPVGARIELKGDGGALNLASFNVLNMHLGLPAVPFCLFSLGPCCSGVAEKPRHYMKFIDKDWQGLEGSKMQQSPAEQRAEELVSVILRILHHPSHPKAVLCLQESRGAFCFGALLVRFFDCRFKIKARDTTKPSEAKVLSTQA